MSDISKLSARLLVVEDNDFVRMQVVKFLQVNDAFDFDIVEAGDGSAALEQMSSDIDLAIVDIRMEPIDGFEFIRSIRSKDLQTPVVLVTGDNNPDLLSEANKWQVSAVLMKPVQKDILNNTVNRILSKRSR